MARNMYNYFNSTMPQEEYRSSKHLAKMNCVVKEWVTGKAEGRKTSRRMQL